jgi:hypothetical protein
VVSRVACSRPVSEETAGIEPGRQPDPMAHQTTGSPPNPLRAKGSPLRKRRPGTSAKLHAAPIHPASPVSSGRSFETADPASGNVDAPKFLGVFPSCVSPSAFPSAVANRPTVRSTKLIPGGCGSDSSETPSFTGVATGSTSNRSRVGLLNFSFWPWVQPVLDRFPVRISLQKLVYP